MIFRWMMQFDARWLYTLISLGLLLAILAQVIAYRSGERKRSRLLGMWIGIAAVLLAATAGQIGSAKLQNYANFINARIGGGL